MAQPDGVFSIMIQVTNNLPYFLLIIMLSVLVILGYNHFSQLTVQSPDQALATARSAISMAKIEKAKEYASNSLTRSMNYYDSAMISWETENKKIMVSRDYSLSNYYADQATYWALHSQQASQVNQRRSKELVSQEIKLLKKQMNQIELLRQNLPINIKESKALAKAKILFEEATLQHSVTLVNQNIDEVKKILASLEQSSKHKLEQYFMDYHQWCDLHEQAVKQSISQKTPLIVVDKLAQSCFTYHSGRLINSYPIEMGANWLGDKQHAGDKMTPEGMYLVTKKKEGSETKYHKALLINYPNEVDKERYRKYVATGAISSSTGIGGLIEIHGHGGKGSNWTDGCIALSNIQMDELYQQCKVGTPVLIVGSLRPLNQVMP